jgi:sugar-specific transcriptional regulator TrmB
MSFTSKKLGTMDTILDDLIELGFLKYEAQVYLALVVSGPMNPTEIAKRSDVPRPNVYDTLKKLLEKGFVIKEDVKRAPSYMAISPSEVISKLKSYKLRELEKLDKLETTFQNDLEKVYIEIMSKMSPTETGWLITGKDKVYNQVKRILDKSTEELFLLIPPDLSSPPDATNDFFKLLLDKSNAGVTINAGWAIDRNSFKIADSLNKSEGIFHWCIG